MQNQAVLSTPEADVNTLVQQVWGGAVRAAGRGRAMRCCGWVLPGHLRGGGVPKPPRASQCLLLVPHLSPPASLAAGGGRAWAGGVAQSAAGLGGAGARAKGGGPRERPHAAAGGAAGEVMGRPRVFHCVAAGEQHALFTLVTLTLCRGEAMACCAGRALRNAAPLAAVEAAPTRLACKKFVIISLHISNCVPLHHSEWLAAHYELGYLEFLPPCWCSPRSYGLSDVSLTAQPDRRVASAWLACRLSRRHPTRPPPVLPAVPTHRRRK